MKEKRDVPRRLLALGLSVATLWAVTMTTGSGDWLSALSALQSGTDFLRWELGDWGGDDLSPAAVVTLGQAPLLLSAREEVTRLWSVPESSAPEPPRDDDKAPVAETPLQTPAPTDNGIPARTLVPSGSGGYTVVGNVHISNGTEFSLAGLTPDTAAQYDATLTDQEPQILILHTHGSEAYTLPPGESYEASGNHRTLDTRYNVVRVGDEMAAIFAEAGLSVLHDRTLYDYPQYNGSYTRSLAATEAYLKKYPSLRFILDVHRDAIEDGAGNEYKVVSLIDGVGTAAQVSLIVGSSGSGLAHPRWMENLKLATTLQQSVLTAYPTLMRPVVLRNSRYNQHAATGALLIEVGAAGNSPEEALLAARLFTEQMIGTLTAKNK
ncbi:MAG: stage II sporulation protein P [Oscillospiraceae bacterium]